MSLNYLLIISSCPDRAVAEKIAHYLIDQKLAACVNITSPVTSIYRWEGVRESAEELMLLIKTPSEHYTLVESAIKQQHPYELPEIIAVPLERGEPQYLSWIDQCTNPAP